MPLAARLSSLFFRARIRFFTFYHSRLCRYPRRGSHCTTICIWIWSKDHTNYCGWILNSWFIFCTKIRSRIIYNAPYFHISFLRCQMKYLRSDINENFWNSLALPTQLQSRTVDPHPALPQAVCTWFLEVAALNASHSRNFACSHTSLPVST
jgi:hypothetical protein